MSMEKMENVHFFHKRRIIFLIHAKCSKEAYLTVWNRMRKFHYFAFSSFANRKGLLSFFWL